MAEGAERMSDFGSSAASQRRLASELRRLRRRTRLTGKDVSTRFGWSEAKLSRIENGLARVKVEDLDGFLDLYEVSDSRRAELVALAQESREAARLRPSRTCPRRMSGSCRPSPKPKRCGSGSRRWFRVCCKPKITREAVLQLWPAIFARPAAEMERRVETGRVRQNVLARVPPLELSFVVDESVLLRDLLPRRSCELSSLILRRYLSGRISSCAYCPWPEVR